MSALAELRLSSRRLRDVTVSGGVRDQSAYTPQPASVSLEWH